MKRTEETSRIPSKRVCSSPIAGSPKEGRTEERPKVAAVLVVRAYSALVGCVLHTVLMWMSRSIRYGHMAEWIRSPTHVLKRRAARVSQRLMRVGKAYLV